MKKKITKEEFIAEVAKIGEYATVTEARKALNSVVSALEKVFVEDACEGLSLSGFGTFRLRESPARKGRNPRTGAEITIPASKALKFSASKTLFKKP